MPPSHQEHRQTTKPAGPDGRITEADVRAYLDERDAGTVPLTGTRGIIARRMVASLQGSAQFTLVRTADGAPAARFLATLAGYLSKPTALS